jgi:hypothetical protein
MTPDEEIARYKRDLEPHWERLMRNDEFRKAVEAKDVVKVGEIASAQVFGNTPSLISSIRKRWRS